MWKKNKYAIVKQALSKELCGFAYQHLLMKKKVADCLFANKDIPYFSKEWGHYSDPQVPNTYVCYSDLVMEQILTKIKPLIEKKVGVKVIETYSFVRLYKKYDILAKHIDRFSCEYSATLNLGGDPWPFHLISNKKQVTINLKPGDLLIYKGCKLPHWRDVFLGTQCGQTFLHYNDARDKNLWDKRPCLGYPYPPNYDENPKK
tara:strand:+ start:1809 stop:2417 length:609 start_codon:yes stop_codon:yes gene_type:complete